MKIAQFTMQFGVVLLMGCATVREYPRCYLFRGPAQADVAAANVSASEVLAKLVSPDEFTVTKDGAIVTATNVVHREVGKAWPSTGCVNLRRTPPETAATIDKWIVAACQDYLEELARRQEDEATKRPRTDIVRRYQDTFICH